MQYAAEIKADSREANSDTCRPMRFTPHSPLNPRLISARTDSMEVGARNGVTGSRCGRSQGFGFRLPPSLLISPSLTLFRGGLKILKTAFKRT